MTKKLKTLNASGRHVPNVLVLITRISVSPKATPYSSYDTGRLSPFVPSICLMRMMLTKMMRMMVDKDDG